MSKELTLLPCPVCGGKADIIDAFERDEKGHVAIGWSAYCTRGCLTTSEHGSREKAAASWNALPRALEWTDEPPKVPGWYWYRHKPSCTIAMNPFPDNGQAPSPNPANRRNSHGLATVPSLRAFRIHRVRIDRNVCRHGRSVARLL